MNNTSDTDKPIDEREGGREREIEREQLYSLLNQLVLVVAVNILDK